jgi:hypothetical protein
MLVGWNLQAKRAPLDRRVHVPKRTSGDPAPLLRSRGPVCKERLLLGRQTVCSGCCRAKRWQESQRRPLEPDLAELFGPSSAPRTTRGPVRPAHSSDTHRGPWTSSPHV